MKVPGDPAALAPAPPEVLEFFWASPFPATLQDARFRLVDVNDAYLAFSGYARDRLIGLDPIALQPAEDHATTRDRRQRLRTSGGRTTVAALSEGRLIDAAGNERWFRIARHIVGGPEGEPLYLAVLQDTTLEHAARERADRSVRELDDWFDLSPVGMVLFDDSGLIVRTNPAFDEMAGTVPVSLAESEPGLASLLAWGASGRLASLQPGSRPIETPGWIEQAGGRLRPLRSIVRCYRTANGERRYMGIVEDRSLEEERDRVQRQIGALMDTAGVGVATFEESSGWVRQQPASGGPGAAFSALQNITRDIVMAESLGEYERLQSALERTQRAEVRYAIQHPELGQRWLLTRVEPATLASGKKTASVVTLDITDQRQSQRRSEQLLREMTTILESTNSGIAYLRAGVLVRCNRRFETLMRLGANGVAGSSLVEALWRHPHADEVAAEIRSALAVNAHYEIEYPVGEDDVEDGGAGGDESKRRWHSLSARRAGAGTGLDEAIVVVSDVTRIKRQQVQLETLANNRQVQAERTRSILDSVLVGIVTVGAGGIEWMNRSARRMLAGSLSDFVDRPMSIVATPEAAHPFRRTHYLDELVEGQAETFECRVRARDGREFWVVGNAVATGREGAGRQLTYALLDIERRRQAEAAALKAEAALRDVTEARLQGEIAQRDMLVKEVHHRIKNNLQGVAGLLQQIATRKPEVAGAIDEVVGQVQAIAQVYGLQVGAGGPLAVASVLEAIVASVQRTFGCVIGCRIDDAAGWTLPEVEAIPIALTLNELLTNACKHATAEGGPHIECALEGGVAEVRVVISNRARLPAGFSLDGFPNGVSGLGLVRALLPRRSASLALEQAGDAVVATVVLTPPVVSRTA